ncbi:hypothetical protein VTI74DRAFT_2244 [Chaetomium olivicolor]
MDCPWTRRRRTGHLRVPDLALIAVLFLHPSHIFPTNAALLSLYPPPAGHHEPAHALHRRNEGEHVILADCHDGNGVYSSQMAYYSADPNQQAPNDVAVVVTNPGQAALWVNRNTSALFTITAITFTAVLGPRVEEGQFAGRGYNGYPEPFSCYQKYVKDRYTYETTTCSQVYDCDHSDPPSSSGSSGGGMTQGTIIAIAVGVVGGILFLAAAGLVYWYFRRSRRQQEQRTRRPGELLKSTTASSSPGSQVGDNSSQGRPVVQQMSAVCEMDGRLYRVEMANDNGKFEMDAHGHGNAELDASNRSISTPGMSTASAVSPLSPALPDSAALVTEQFPPPSYAPWMHAEKPSA